MTALDIQISIEAEGWSSEEDLSAFASKTLDAAVDFLKREEDQPFPKMPVELSLVFTDDENIREINAEWRDKDKATNVLSFLLFRWSRAECPALCWAISSSREKR